MVDGQSTDIFYTDKKILERESQGKETIATHMRTHGKQRINC